jgi:hypothetical protein
VTIALFGIVMVVMGCLLWAFGPNGAWRPVLAFTLICGGLSAFVTAIVRLAIGR